MSRKRCHRRVIVPVAPKGLRPKLDKATLTKVGLRHIENLDAIATGQCTPELLWEWTESALTWSRAAELTGIGLPEMTAQLELAAGVIERYGRTGRIAFTGPEYQLTKLGLEQMDELATKIDVVVGNQAALWSTAKVKKWSDEIEANRNATARRAA
jgi:hypothetical protein